MFFLFVLNPSLFLLTSYKQDAIFNYSCCGFARILVVYVLHAAISRLYLSPIAKFPVPKLAALTRSYELYYEIVKGGQYTLQNRRAARKIWLPPPDSQIT
jgi:hypothetical protein